MHKYELLKEKLLLLKNELLNQSYILENEKQDKTNKKYLVLKIINETKNKIAKKENRLNFIKNFKNNIKRKINKYFWYGILSFIITSVLMVISKTLFLFSINQSLTQTLSGLFILNSFIFTFIFFVNNISNIILYYSERNSYQEYESEIESLSLELEKSREEYYTLQNLENDLILRLDEINKSFILCSNYEDKINSKITEINTKKYRDNIEVINEIFEVDSSIEEVLSLVRRFGGNQ